MQRLIFIINSNQLNDAVHIILAINYGIEQECNPDMLQLTDKLKGKIRQIHKKIGKNLPNYQPRQQQNYLVAEIAKTLGGIYNQTNRICVIEAGTGTGKSLAYCLGTIILAKEHQCKVVISTATVALQEQLTHKDLPFFAKMSGLDVKFDLVKGRQRYCCRHKLAMFADQQTTEHDYQQLLLEPPNHKQQDLLQQLYQAHISGRWNGDRDAWSTTIPDATWSLIVSDKHSCSRSIKEHQQCPFHQARERVKSLDVLVVNHALLLADLELGGGIILNSPEKTIYVIDEGHHLPQITRDFAAAQASTKGARDWLEKLPTSAEKIQRLLKTPRGIGIATNLQDTTQQTRTLLAETAQWLEHNHHALFNTAEQSPKSNQKPQKLIQRFENGQLPQPLVQKAQDLSPLLCTLINHTEKLQELLKEEINDQTLDHTDGDPLLVELSFFAQRLDNLHRLWSQWQRVPDKKTPPHARWIEAVNNKNTVDYLLATAPIDVGLLLAEKLWQNCAGAVICSATLTALGSFAFFRDESGLNDADGSQYIQVNSPFNYTHQAKLRVPKLTYEPTAPQFTDELIHTIPSIVKPHQAVLVLFSSYWQMNQVADALQTSFTNQGIALFIQGKKARQTIINQHKRRINKGQSSIIFGSQSFSEGLDLPGKYLTQVVITKIPFAVPTSPVEQAHAEYVKAQGKDPFMELSVPQASKKLVQAVGRLLRNEQDSGEVVILDRRLVSKRYGQRMLNALPPFSREIET